MILCLFHDSYWLHNYLLSSAYKVYLMRGEIQACENYLERETIITVTYTKFQAGERDRNAYKIIWNLLRIIELDKVIWNRWQKTDQEEKSNIQPLEEK